MDKEHILKEKITRPSLGVENQEKTEKSGQRGFWSLERRD
jgi:hypothetical protein